MTRTPQISTQHPYTAGELTTTGTALLAGPLLLLGYGVVRLLDGHHGPGPGWTAGHILLILGLLCFVPAVLTLRRTAAGSGPARRATATAGAVLSLLGIGAVLGQAAVDLYVGAVSADRAAMNTRYDHFQSHPGVTPLLYSVVPAFFYLGLLLLTGALALGRPRRIGLYAPVCILLGTLVMAASLDLMPVGALLYSAAFGPLALSLLRRGRADEQSATCRSRPKGVGTAV
ncbi:hypothetical protein EDD99_3793 [Streptomyces sp. 846.5]|nr:hypothetical protein [Streptomyces sp. 846.5]TDU05286.1 hypothetical protein EDD99_3793 [Streptomyces sp. 846.5]